MARTLMSTFWVICLGCGAFGPWDNDLQMCKACRREKQRPVFAQWDTIRLNKARAADDAPETDGQSP